MNITYMIGNGFDISLGLKTRYEDFYMYERNKVDNGEKINNQLLNYIISSDEKIKLWSDLEIGLGDYVECIGDSFEKSRKFYKEKYDIENRLMRYLNNQQDNINWDDVNVKKCIQDVFCKGIKEFWYPFKQIDKDNTKSVIGDEKIDFKIVSFNYTNTLDKCISISSICNIELAYIHGSLKDKNIILGVDNPEQIKNKFFKGKDEMKIAMCKPYINRNIGEYYDRTASMIINNSNIICIFGMSIGATDETWWNAIIRNMITEKIKKVIVFVYDKKIDMGFRTNVFIKENEIRDKLLSYAHINDEMLMSKLKDRILVYFNSGIFDFNFELKN